MAEAEVEPLVEKLKQLLLQRAHVTPGAVNQAKRLEETLGLFKRFELPKQWSQDENGKELIRHIWRILFDAEEIIEACVNQADADKLFHVDGSKIVGVVDQVEAVVKKFLFAYPFQGDMLAPVEDGQDETESTVHTEEEKGGPSRQNPEGERAAAEMEEEYLVEKLKQLLLQHVHLTPEAANQAKRLEKILGMLKDFEVPDQWREGEKGKELILRIRSIFYYAKEIIGTSLNQAKHNHFHIHRSEIVAFVDQVEAAVKKFLYGYPFQGHKHAPVKAVETKGHEHGPVKVKRKRKKKTKESSEQKHHVKKVNMVGFEDEVETLKSYLFQDYAGVDVISIVGIAGLGKTTLAESIFNHPDVHAEFPIRLWVDVSQDFTLKDIFLGILEEFTIITEDFKSKTDKMLAGLVVGYLKNEKFFLVMDDVWSPGDWSRLQVALPMSDGNGKVLITTRKREVGLSSSRFRRPHCLRFLHEEEGISLLKSEAFRDIEISQYLEDSLRKIVNFCRGHPLAIVLIAGILVNELSSERRAKCHKFSYSLSEKLRAKDPLKCLEKIILMSYGKLSPQLKKCLLYFGMFPEDFEIPAWKLIQLWIAEGFIPQKSGVNLEETAEEYLEGLIVRKLVKLVKFKLDDKVKTCRVHDMIRDFCLAEAGKEREDFLQEIKTGEGSQTPVSTESKLRRLCIHSNVLKFVSKKPCSPCVRSFLYSSRSEITLPMEDISVIPKGFKLLRVLDVEPIKFTYKIPREMFQLYNLRYLVLSVNLQVLPSSFSMLWYIQTLVFNTTSRTLEIRADLLNMTRLMHFKTKASSTLPTTSSSSEAAGREIQTFGAIAPESCTEIFFGRVPNLKRLGVRGKLALLLDVNNKSLDGLGKLSNLEKLKLLNDVFPAPPSEARLCGLPPASKFPPNLKILTLSRTSLDWHHMSILGSLENLVVLKVKDKAFVGDTWEVTDGGFCKLEVLHIDRTNLKDWLASDHHFPNLKHLQLKHCDYLEKIPMELADVPSFIKLDLFHCKRAAASALEIGKRKKQENQRSDNLVPEFKLSVFPWRSNHASI